MSKFLSNPNLHVLLALVSGAASIAFPLYAPILQGVAGLLGVTGIVLPEQAGQAILPAATALVPATAPVPTSPVVAVTLPVAQPTQIVLPSGRSMHQADYMAILLAVISALQQAQQPQQPK